MWFIKLTSLLFNLILRFKLRIFSVSIIFKILTINYFCNVLNIFDKISPCENKWNFFLKFYLLIKLKEGCQVVSLKKLYFYVLLVFTLKLYLLGLKSWIRFNSWNLFEMFITIKMSINKTRGYCVRIVRANGPNNSLYGPNHFWNRS